MFYPARWKKITVDQSKVLKNRLYRLFRFFVWATRYSRLSLQTAGLLSRAPRARSGATHFHARATRARSGAPPPPPVHSLCRGAPVLAAGLAECQPDASYAGCPPPPPQKKKQTNKKKTKKTDSPCGPNLTKLIDTMRFYHSTSKMIPKYPDSVEWFLIDRHFFSKQWSDPGAAPRGGGGGGLAQQ